MMEIKFLDERIKAFTPATQLSAGFDLRACVDTAFYLIPGEIRNIGTGIAINMGEGIEQDSFGIIHPCAVIMPRSGLGCRGIKPRNVPGLIDADYQGEIVICLYNESNDAVHVNPMDRIAQLVFMLALHPKFTIVEEFSVKTDRGTNGFGSTGK